MSFEKSYPPDIQKIVDAGFQVAEKSPWHYHVYHDNTFTNIWHTTKKYMTDYDSCSTVYSDISEVIETFETPTGKPSKELFSAGDPSRAEAIKEVESFHEKLRRNLEQAHQDRIKRKASEQ